MKTILEIRADLAAAGKPVSTVQLYRYLRRFNIPPLTRTRPKFYPSDAARWILDGLGLVNNPCQEGQHGPDKNSGGRERELLVDCPFCRRTGFTVRGLQNHWCFAKAQKILAASSKVKLTKEEVQQAIDQARLHEPGQSGGWRNYDCGE